mgnify:FL=1
MKKKKFELEVPGGADKVLLHTCCAPCSSAIIECLLNHGIRPTIYYCNPNIYPLEEYNIVRTSVLAMPSRWAWILWMQIMTMHPGVARWPDLKTSRSAEGVA